MLKGEILISGKHSGYIQYTIVFDHEWMTRRVKMSSMFDSQEKRLVLEVDQDRRWYRVAEHRLARTRSFYRSGLSQCQTPGESVSPQSHGSGDGHSKDGSHNSEGQCCMQDADAMSDCSASCYSSSSDSECSIPFEKINLTWTPPPKGAKRASKRFSSSNPLSPKVMTATTINHDGQTSLTNSSTSTPTSTITVAPQSPIVGFAPHKALTRTVSTSSLTGPKKFEHLPQLDGCVNLDLGYDMSPSTILPSLKRLALGVEPGKLHDHLETLPFDESTTEKTAVVSFPDLELHPIQTHLAYVGPGSKTNMTIMECWRDDEDESTLVEVDDDGLVVRYGHLWARIPSS